MVINSLQFDDINSADFDVIISGEGVFDAPVRNVEAVSIPGRNGDLLIDRKSFSNIDVTYPAHSFKANDYPTFISYIDAFRNALASKMGYQRLVDTFHPDEFRMATFKEGLKVNPIMFNSAAEFDLVFNCKPQRFLRSGEIPVEFTSSGTMDNPTMFESSPLLEVEGRGDIIINGYTVNINVDPLGELQLFKGGGLSADFADVPYAPGDDITVKNTGWMISYRVPSGASVTTLGVVNVSGASAMPSASQDGKTITVSIFIPTASFVEGTASTVSASLTLTADGTLANSNSFSEQISISVAVSYDGAKRITATYTQSGATYVTFADGSTKLGDGFIDSSLTSLNETLYIDCELGEVYTSNGQSWNNAVNLGVQLPVLSPGENIIIIPNTINTLNIIPRWWRI